MLAFEERSALVRLTLKEFVQGCEAVTVPEGVVCVGTLIACAAKSIEENLSTRQAIEVLVAVAQQLAADSPDCVLHVEKQFHNRSGKLDA